MSVHFFVSAPKAYMKANFRENALRFLRASASMGCRQEARALNMQLYGGGDRAWFPVHRQEAATIFLYL
jgi:hypothetical protein